MFLPGSGPIAIADWPSIVLCHLLVKIWVLAPIGAVVEMGVLSTLKRLLMESNQALETNERRIYVHYNVIPYHLNSFHGFAIRPP
jgi:hypothetical protein